MRLDTKYFVPFIIGIGLIGMLAIIWSTFRFNSKQLETFNSKLSTEFREYSEQELLVLQPGVWAEGLDSLRFSSIQQDGLLVLFSARWSEKSSALLTELERLTNEQSQVPIVIALVLDTKEGLAAGEQANQGISENSYRDDINYAAEITIVDGSILYNRYQVPGIPTLVFQDANQVLWTHVGFRSPNQLTPLIRLLEDYN